MWRIRGALAFSQDAIRWSDGSGCPDILMLQNIPWWDEGFVSITTLRNRKLAGWVRHQTRQQELPDVFKRLEHVVRLVWTAAGYLILVTFPSIFRGKCFSSCHGMFVRFQADLEVSA